MIVDIEKGQRRVLLIDNIAQPISPRWLNEKFIFLRIAWGRVVFSDLIWDVESGELIYHEAARYGRSAFEQYQLACNGQCPCPPIDSAGRNPAAIATSSGRQQKSGETPLSQPAADQMIGFLKLPGLFGLPESGPPDAPVAVPVYAAAETGAEKLADLSAATYFESAEYAHAAPAVLVYQRQPRWFQVGLTDASPVRERRAWVFADSADGFLSLGELLTQRVAYLNSKWDGRLWKAPDIYEARSARIKQKQPELREYPVNVVEHRNTPGGLWLKVDILTKSPCESASAKALESGWIPAYNQSGQAVAGFYARGC